VNTHKLLVTLFLLLVLVLSACSDVGRAAETTPTAGVADVDSQPTAEGSGADATPALAWEGQGLWGDEDATRCKTLQIGADGQMTLGYCGQTLTVTSLNRPEFGEMLERLAAFELETPTDSLVFQGRGQIDDPAWQRAVLAWVHWTFGETWSGRACAACRTALSWHLGPLTTDDPSQCAHLTVLDYGQAYAEVRPCEGGPVLVQANGWLETDEWGQLDEWLTGRSELYSGDNYLAGAGSQSMTQAEQAQLEELARGTYTRLSGVIVAHDPTPPQDGGPTAACPAATAETRLLANAGQGYCLLYPLAYKVEKPSANQTDLVVGSLLNVQDPRVSIVVEPASGRTAATASDQIVADFQGFDIERTGVSLGGVEGIVLDKLPGQEINRRVVLEHAGLLYQLTFTPADESTGDAYTGMEALYDTIVASFTLIPASAEVLPGQDCLEAKADEQPLTFEAYNFCLLAPQGYEVAEPTANQVVLYVGSLLDVEHPRAYIAVGEAGGRSAEQIAADLAAEVEAGMPGWTVERTFGLTLGYEPAWVLENVPGQDLSRQVLVVHDDRLYKLTFVPASPDAGAIYAEMEHLYAALINSFRFLR